MKIKNTILLIGLILNVSCDDSAHKEFQSLDIKGDWISESFEYEWSTKTLVFSFQDSICSYLYPYGEFTRYWITGDTLKIKERRRFWNGYKNNDYIEGKEVFSFLINPKDERTITLKPLTEASQALLKQFKNVGLSEELKLKKTTKKNDFKFDRIGFYSTGCNGACPVMYLEIDKNGNLFFHGKRYTEKIGLLKGKLDGNQIDLINKKINAIQLDSLKEFYSSQWMGAQICGMRVKIGNTFYESTASGIHEEPVELRLLLYKLMEIYREVDLTSDSTLVNKFQFEDFMLRGNPPPPPPPPPIESNNK